VFAFVRVTEHREKSKCKNVKKQSAKNVSDTKVVEFTKVNESIEIKIKSRVQKRTV
jgi:hypothetical protein